MKIEQKKNTMIDKLKKYDGANAVRGRRKEENSRQFKYGYKQRIIHFSESKNMNLSRKT